MAVGWDPAVGSQPIPPSNGMVTSAFAIGVLDIRWDNPAILSRNTSFQVVGVNLYRSDDGDRGPYFRLNDFPIGGTFWRDRTDNVQIQRELVDWNTSWLNKGNAPNDRRWVFRTKYPIHKQLPHGPYGSPTAANAPSDVTVLIDGVVIPVSAVYGPTGDVTLINVETLDEGREKLVPAAIPTATSIVEVTYYTNRNHVRSGLDTALYYRLTTVVVDATTPSGYRETDLAHCEPISSMVVERLDYIWREAIRRNQWILQNGGERVKIFIRKQAGIPCFCQTDAKTREFSGQPSNRCTDCYGTGFLRGYEGPYDSIIAPDDAERRISQGPTGRRKEHTYEVWMGPSPVVTQRDFIVKQTNERYSIGPSRRPSNRGNLLQQHFNIAYFDEQDIRYQVPIDGVDSLVIPQTRYSTRLAPSLPVDGALQDTPPYPVGPDAQTPMQTNRTDTPDELEQRGRTPVWENVSR